MYTIKDIIKKGSKDMADDKIEMTGVVTKVLRGSKFIVTIDKLPSGQQPQIECILAGRLRANKIRIIEGDRVDVGVSPYDLTKGIIAWRHK